jgi:hypothetical protein
MGLTFTTADTVATGDEIKGSQLKSLADAFNDRLRSGVADPTYRIHHYFLSAWRQIRTGEGLTFPANSEFLESYMHVNPSQGSYPEPYFQGEGGMNPGNVMIQFVAGLPAIACQGDESPIRCQDETRINIDISNPSTLRGKWELAKRQRGYRDPVAETQVAPAVQAADLYNLYLGNSVNDKAYGGFSAQGLTGAVIQKTAAKAIERLGFQSFVSEFRGSTSQRAEDIDDIENIAFDFQHFLTSQYQLSPNYGTGGAAVYPKFEATGATISAGAIGSPHTINAEFVLGGALFEAEGLSGSATLTIKRDGVKLRQVTLTQDSLESLQFFDVEAGGEITVTLEADAEFEDSNGRITIECSELYEVQPGLQDAYLFLRLATTTGNVLDDSTDAIGINYASSKQISDDYKAFGCLIGSNQVPQQVVFGVNDNPVWDAARRRTREYVRVITRESLMGYSATANKSTLYFKRYKFIDGENYDMWDGIVDAIQDDPDQGEYSNEWLTFFQFKGFNNSESSIWKPSAYSDYWSMSERCQFAGQSLENSENGDYYDHFQSNLAPEASTGYRYIGTTNPTNFLDSDERSRFYKSCKIYAPDYEVESVTSTNIDGVEAVAVTYKTRFHRSATAPASVAFDIGTWDIDQINEDEYRTDENAIMSYILHAQLGAAMVARKTGDTATDWQPVLGTDQPHATIYPHFFFTKLIPFAGTGEDGVWERDDARPIIDQLQQCELYLRCMCEGYIDGPGTASYECDLNGSSLYDYTFQALCQEANGLNRISFLPADLLTGETISAGPLPNTLMYAEVFNQLARAVNLLDKARVAIPYKLFCKEYFFETYQDITADWDNGACTSPPGSVKAVWTGTAPAPSTLTAETDWQECTQPGGPGNPYGFQSTVNSQIDAFTCGTSGAYLLKSEALIVEFRFEPRDPLFTEAIPSHILELMRGGQGGFLGYLQTAETTREMYAVATGGEAIECDSNQLFHSGTGYNNNIITNDSTQCVLISSGALDPGTTAYSGHYLIRWGSATHQFCSGGFSRTLNLTADPSNTSFFVQVPLV